MALSYNEYTANGSQNMYSTPPYLDEAHLEVFLNGVEQSSSTYTVTGTSLVFNDTPTAGTTVRVGRNSNSSARLTDYADASLLTADVMDFDSNQLFYIAQEALDKASETNVAAKTFYSSGLTPPEDPTIGNLWYDTNSKLLKVFNGLSWDLATPSNETLTFNQSDFIEQAPFTYVNIAGINTNASVYLNGVKQVIAPTKENLVEVEGAKDYYVDLDLSRLYFKALAASDVVQVILSLYSLNPAQRTIEYDFIATDNQTVFELSDAYIPNTGSMHVYLNGVKQSAYTETDSNTVTFDEGLNTGDEVSLVINKYIKHSIISDRDDEGLLTINDNQDGSYTITDPTTGSVITIRDGNDGAIPTVTDNGDGTFTIDNGHGDVVTFSDGITPTRNEDYFDGSDGSFVSFIYKVSASLPTTPTGGTFDGTNEAQPEGWSDDPTADTNDIEWVSKTRYTHDVATDTWTNDGWSTPSYFYQRGDDGDDGDTPQLGFDYFNGNDGSFVSFIYKDSISKPLTPTGGTFNGNSETFPSGNWYDAPTETTADIEWVSTTKYTHNSTTDTWTNNGWSEPRMFFQRGQDGADGTSVTIKGSFATTAGLSTLSETPTLGDGYIIDGELYVCVNLVTPINANNFENVGAMAGNDGVDGTDGTNNYIHFAYADDNQGTGFSETDADGKSWLGIYVDQSSDDSDHWGHYTWQLIKGTDGQSITWKGDDLTAHPANPEDGWAYYNSTDKKSYIYNDNAWFVMTEDGNTPLKGVDYFDGGFVSFIYKVSATAPATPTGGIFNGTAEAQPLGWSDNPTANPDDTEWVSKTKYIQTGETTWEHSGWSAPSVFYQKGADGVHGVDGMVYKGASASSPSNPQLNWAYRDTDDGIIYIYNGNAWETMVYDGDEGPAGAPGGNGLSVFITYTDRMAQVTKPTNSSNGNVTVTSSGILPHETVWNTTPTNNTHYMSQKVAASATAGTWSEPIRIRGVDGNAASQGPAGSGRFFGDLATYGWTDAQAVAVILADAQRAPTLGDVVSLSRPTNRADEITKMYNGSDTWGVVELHLNGSLLVDGSISADAIATNAIEAIHIATNAIEAIHISADQINTGHINSTAIRSRHIATDAITADHITANTITTENIVSSAISEVLYSTSGTGTTLSSYVPSTSTGSVTVLNKGRSRYGMSWGSGQPVYIQGACWVSGSSSGRVTVTLHRKKKNMSTNVWGAWETIRTHSAKEGAFILSHIESYSSDQQCQYKMEMARDNADMTLTRPSIQTTVMKR